MLEGVPVALLNGIGVVGIVVTIAALFWRSFKNGDFVTRREAEVYITRAEKAEAMNEQLVKQNGELMEMARLGTATFNALRRASDQ